MDKRIQELHNEVGREFSPFNLAKFMQIRIKNVEMLPNVLGFYLADRPNHFFINSQVDQEKQEDVCYSLVMHAHKNKEWDKWITEETYGQTMRDERIYAMIKRAVINSKLTRYVIVRVRLWKEKSSLQ